MVFNDFKTITQTVGGKKEKERFEKLKNRVSIQISFKLYNE